MELRQLRYFVALAERLHFGKAAAEVRIAQPSLSQQIRRLEDELGVRLFDRTRRRVRLSEAGRRFLGDARDVLLRAERAAAVAQLADAGEVGLIRIGVGLWMDSKRIAEAIREMKALHPGIAVELRAAPTVSQAAALEDEALDVGFVRPPLDRSWLHGECVVREPFIAALPESLRISQRPRVPLASLAAEPFVLPPRDRLPRLLDLVVGACREAGFAPRVQGETDSLELALDLVDAGVAVTLVPAWARRLARPKTVFRPISPSPRVVETFVAWRAGERSRVLPIFLRAVRQASASRRASRPAAR